MPESGGGLAPPDASRVRGPARPCSGTWPLCRVPEHVQAPASVTPGRSFRPGCGRFSYERQVELHASLACGVIEYSDARRVRRSRRRRSTALPEVILLCCNMRARRAARPPGSGWARARVRDRIDLPLRDYRHVCCCCFSCVVGGHLWTLAGTSFLSSWSVREQMTPNHAFPAQRNAATEPARR